MNNRDFSNLGEEIRHTVEDAMNSMDYGQLNQRINQTVNKAMDEARRQFERYNYNKPPYVTPPPPPPHVTPPPSYASPDMKKKTKTVKTNRIQTKSVGKVAGVVLTILGVIGTTAMLPLAIPFGILAFAETTATGKAAGLIIFSISVLALLLFIVCLVKGSCMWSRYRLFKKYLAILDGRDFCTIEELCTKTGQPPKKVRKKLKEMIKKGMFLEGFIDEQETCLIVTNEAYQMYRQVQEAKRQREAEEEIRKQQEEMPKSAIDEMVAKGDHYIRMIREANDDIPGELISQKLDHLEMIVRKIFESVKKHPEQMDEMDKFMEYYLPTTEKLVNAYREFDALPVKGENVTTSMREIENTLDTIIHAFEQLLDDLFMDAAFDISSDISVLHTMLAREGYKEKDFK